MCAAVSVAVSAFAAVAGVFLYQFLNLPQLVSISTGIICSGFGGCDASVAAAGGDGDGDGCSSLGAHYLARPHTRLHPRPRPRPQPSSLVPPPHPPRLCDCDTETN